MSELSQLPVRVGGAEAFLDVEQGGELAGVGRRRRVELGQSTATRTPYQRTSSSPDSPATSAMVSMSSARAGAPVAVGADR